MKVVTLDCEGCGKAFEREAHRHRWNTKHGRAAYCSPSCASRTNYHKRPLSDVNRRPVHERFWEKVDKSGDCWLWTGTLNRWGYGQIRAEGFTGWGFVGAHRYSFITHHGRPVRRGRELHHTCENPACVRPDHLIEVTRAEHLVIHDNDISTWAAGA